MSNVNVTVPQMIRWSNVKLPQDWYLTTECPPKPIQRSLNDLNYIQPYLDGTVKISFDRPVQSTVQLEQLPTPGQSFKIPARHSSAESSSITERDLEADRVLIDFKINELRKQKQVVQPSYGKVPTEPVLPV